MPKPKPAPAKGPSQRQLRVGELLRHSLAGIFLTEDIDDEDLAGLKISVGEVRASPDLRHATVFVSVLGQGGNEALAAALNRHQRFIRGALARRVELKYVPDIVFKADTMSGEIERIEALLRSPEVTRDLR
jgi:ribosome-binding factor A